MSKPKYIPPVKSGERLELMVETLASSGDGLCHHKGYTLFIPTALKGDRALAEVTRITPRFGVARLVNIIEDSPDRVPAPCPVFLQCGGCKLQNLSYEKQMEFKVQMVTDSLVRIGKLEIPEVIQTLPAENPYHYRNKGSFAVQEKQGKLRIGFFKEGTHDVENSDQCAILLQPINEMKEWIRKLLLRHHISIYNEKSHRGFFRGMVIRHSPSTGESLIGLLTTSNIFPKAFVRNLANSEQINQFNITGIVQNFNPGATNVILGDVTRVIWGQDHFNDRLGDLQFRLSLNSFSQVNPEQTVRLYDLVRDWTLGGGTEGRVIDAYCGSGGISLWLARSGASVLGIEEVVEAVESARYSAQINGLADRCEFLAGDAEIHMAQTDIRAVVLDPPRKGCSEKTINAVAEMHPERIVYVSCNPSTLARDIGKLSGYKIKKLCVVDMFPQTPHVETVVLLQRV